MVEINFIHNYGSHEYEPLLKKVIEEAGKVEDKECSINIVFMNDNEIKKYNKQYRDKDYATDVLSFESLEEYEIGDILISMDKVKSQALEYKHSIDREIAFLVVHGFLHLNGYDHLCDSDEKIMFDKQNLILNNQGITR